MYYLFPSPLFGRGEGSEKFINKLEASVERVIPFSAFQQQRPLL
jgi:hypothetical protein